MRRRAVLTAFVLPLVAGCFVTPLEEQAVVTFSVDVPSSTFAAGSGSGSTPWDGYDRFHLTTFPKYVRVAVEYKDYELTHGGWPDPKLGIGAGEGPEGEVEVTLQVPAGANRRLRVLGFVTDLAGVLVYQEEEVKLLNLAAGQSQDLNVKMRPIQTGTVDLNVRCQEGNMGPWNPVQVALVDARAQVVFPTVALKKTGEYLDVSIPGVPVGRPFATDVVVQHADSGKQASMQVVKPTFSVAAAGEHTAVNLVIPCSLAGS